MRIITRRRLLDAANEHSTAAKGISFWYSTAKAVEWSNFVDTRKTFSHADQVRVKSGRNVTIFNVSKSYRLITAIHYNKQRIFILKFLTHPEYERGRWKEEL